MDLEKIEFKQLFNILKNNPETFLLRNDIVLLHQFLMDALKINTNQKDKQLYSLFSWNNFHDFSVNYISQKRMNYSKTSDNWCYEIRNVCNNEVEELELFFAIFKEFMDCFYKVKLNK